MWDAAKRCQVHGGMAVETSMGIGNFMGLMPEGMAGNTRFIGVEYDSLTARMAALLYPQATVLHSGLQKVPLPDSVFDLNIGNPHSGTSRYGSSSNPSSTACRFITSFSWPVSTR